MTGKIIITAYDVPPGDYYAQPTVVTQTNEPGCVGTYYARRKDEHKLEVVHVIKISTHPGTLRVVEPLFIFFPDGAKSNSLSDYDWFGPVFIPEIAP